MLQSIRDNSQSIVAKIIVGLIVVTFALFGVESLVSLTAGSNAPATVNGEEISERELMQGVELQRRQMLAQMGENADPTLLQDEMIRASVLEGLIEQSVLVQSAQNQNMQISDQLIDQLIVTTQEFQLDGKFDRTQFEAALRNAGLTPLMYRDILRKEKLMEQERFGYLLSAFSLPGEAEHIVSLDRQQRDMSYFVLPVASYLEQAVVTDAQIEEAYQAKKSELMTPEQVVVDYLLLERDELKSEVSVSNEELQSQYQTLVSNFQAGEERGAAHILVEVNDNQEEAAAQARIGELAARLQAGEDFAVLAKEASEDFGSADNGGDLGVNPKGVFDKAFEDALYELVNVGDISTPVRSEFGFHLIKLTEKKAQQVPAFVEVESQLRDELVSAKVDELYVARLKELEDISFSSGDLAEPADVLGLAVHTSDPFGRQGGESVPASNQRVIKAAFGEEVLKEQLNSNVIELDAGRAVVVHLNEHQLPRQQTLAEVAEQLESSLKAEAAAAALKKAADVIMAELESGKDIVSVSGAYQLISRSGVQRGDRQLPFEISEDLFAMAHPQGKPVYKTVNLFDGSVAIVALDKVIVGNVADLKDGELATMKRILAARMGQQTWSEVINSRKNAAEIERL
ncbi:MAG: SurA N-terminal domain-containing protein [Marinobacterium sp.]|nr:SurA N-terminal domain-containing protein [Marinobacterium sp.]